MPPKSNRLKNNQKAEISDKVREIRQRQESWLKQRNQQKKRSSPTEGHKSTPPRHVMRQTHTIHKGDSPLYDATRPETGTYNQDGVGDGGSPDSAATERLLSHTHQRSLSPEMFEALADQIIHKVNNELRIDVRASEDNQRYENQREEEVTSLRGSQQKMTSHNCQICGRVMMGPDCSPQLLIPCGHTFCARCVGPRCPACNTPVQTVTPNLMLQQAITEYCQQKPDGSTDGGAKRPPRRSQPKPKSRDLSGEYETLTMRCEVLATEGNEISARIEGLEHAVQGKLRKGEKVQEQRRFIDGQIEQLKEKQRSLMAVREGYLEESEGLQEQVREEEDRLTMITSTIRALQKDMEKIKDLANGTPR